jgi:hypothetical protein
LSITSAGAGSAYETREAYADSLPRYLFEGVDANEVVISRLSALSASRSRELIDCGAGPGTILPHLVAYFRSITAVEPNRALWPARPADSVQYVAESGFYYLLNAPPLSTAVVSWLWSINYAIMAFFESWDTDRKMTAREDDISGDAKARATLHAVLRRWGRAPHFIAFFDETSVEQRFVTSVWEQEAPFPFDDRGHCRKLLSEALTSVALEHNAVVTCEHLAGVAHYGSIEDAITRMYRFQFHGRLTGQPWVRRIVREFVARHLFDGSVCIPAGCFLYSYVPRSASVP